MNKNPRSHEAMKGNFKLLTYNVHEGVGGDNQQNYNRLVEVIGEINPDILTLQEVDADLNNSDGHKSFVFETIIRSLEYTGIKGITMIRSRSTYGNATFARIQPEEIQRHDISFNNREPRGVLDCIIRIHGQPLRILNTHLGLKRKERAHQIKVLRQIIMSSSDMPLILSGDFNEWLTPGLQAKMLQVAIKAVPRQRTFPARFPLFALDRIFYNQKIHQKNFYRHDSKLGRLASDHRPLVAEFEFN
jgi:endonuclease/exonuclease/phosphatase family metal-dependent hydrolase